MSPKSPRPELKGNTAIALADCDITIPGSDSAAAQVAFTHLARMHAGGQAAERWILGKVLITAGVIPPLPIDL